MSEEADHEQDPFDAKNLAISQFITSLRIYDALMALLTAANPDMAKDLLSLHAQGMIMTPQPAFVGTFIFDETNTPLRGETNNPDE